MISFATCCCPATTQHFIARVVGGKPAVWSLFARSMKFSMSENLGSSIKKKKNYFSVIIRLYFVSLYLPVLNHFQNVKHVPLQGIMIFLCIAEDHIPLKESVLFPILKSWQNYTFRMLPPPATWIEASQKRFSPSRDFVHQPFTRSGGRKGGEFLTDMASFLSHPPPPQYNHTHIHAFSIHCARQR